jgi:hypothetical protein
MMNEKIGVLQIIEEENRIEVYLPRQLYGKFFKNLLQQLNFETCMFILASSYVSNKSEAKAFCRLSKKDFYYLEKLGVKLGYRFYPFSHLVELITNKINIDMVDKIIDALVDYWGNCCVTESTLVTDTLTITYSHEGYFEIKTHCLEDLRKVKDLSKRILEVIK